VIDLDPPFPLSLPARRAEFPAFRRLPCSLQPPQRCYRHPGEGGDFFGIENVRSDRKLFRHNSFPFKGMVHPRHCKAGDLPRWDRFVGPDYRW
jgi:hypothetical protein